MSHRRLIQLIVLLALALAPFGRIGLAQARANHQPMMAAHCAGKPMPDSDTGHRMAVDCTIACAAMAPAPAPLFVPPPAAEAVPAPVRLFFLAGIRPEADPPSPRFS